MGQAQVESEPGASSTNTAGGGVGARGAGLGQAGKKGGSNLTGGLRAPQGASYPPGRLNNEAFVKSN